MNRGFTLIELGVVLMVVGILTALVIPGYRYATARADSAKCLGNLRSIGLALNGWLADNNMTMPPLVAGDIVGKEIEDGTMRMMLSRPVSRGRILAIKIVAIVVYSLVLSWFISLTALAAGLIHSGAGGLFVFAPMEKVFALHEFGPGMWRYFLASFLLGFALLSIPSIGFFFSCFDMKPAAATIITLSILFLDTILKNIPYFDSLRPYFLTARMTAWVFVFEYRIPWERILEDYVWLAAINLTLVILAWLVFSRRDFKS